jgi:alkanesulfonate monooxygenase SsuD/methylene tetrahydromethanopterin reductase-like flavin-dependent oxidoreductase (luciferase family)
MPEADIGPKPVRPGGPRLMSGAGSTAAAERAGRLGVGLTLVIFDWDTIRETIETFRTAAGAAGHDADTLPIMFQVNGNVTAEPWTTRTAARLHRPGRSRSRPSRQARHRARQLEL